MLLERLLQDIKKWRKKMGVEPTRERLTPPTGFEARPPHQGRFSSIKYAMIYSFI
jgi:hypothetical protein